MSTNMKNFTDIVLSDDSLATGLGSCAVIAAAAHFGYDRIDSCGEDSVRARHKCVVIALEKKMHKKRRGIIEIRIMVYPDRHVVMVCIFDEKTNGARNKNKGDDHDGSLPDDEKYRHGDLFNKDNKYLYVAQNITDIDKLKELLSQPMDYGLSRGLCYSRQDNFVDKWSPPIQRGVDMICSHCGKAGVHVDDATNRGRGGGALLRACTKCKGVVYCSTECQRGDWKGHKKVCTERRDFDAARRWCCVAIASGLTADPSELEAIRDVCQLFDEILFEDGAPPCLAHTRHGCGVICALSDMLLDIGHEHHNVTGFADIDQSMDVYFGKIDEVHQFDRRFPPCRNVPDFNEEHGRNVTELERRLTLLNDSIRAEIIGWQFERIRCDLGITMITSDQKPLIEERKTFPCQFLHMDYTQLVYGDVDEKIFWRMYGIVDLYGDDSDNEKEEEEDDLDREIESCVANMNGASYQDDIEIVMTQARCSRERALQALYEHKGDIVNAIMSLY